MPRRSASSTVAPAPVTAPARPPAARPPAAPTRPVDIGGFRLVRQLDDDGEVATWVARGADETVVLRVFRETAADERIDAETLARERLIGACAPELVDIATSPAGRPALVVRAVIGPTLDDLLQRREEPLRAGHVTTLLAPLAALVAAAHETGATLGRLDAKGIRIDPSGRPVVVALGRAAVGAPLPTRFRSHEPRIVTDRAQLDELAGALAALVDPHERASVERALTSGAGDPERLELALFDCAAPLPIVDLASATRSRSGAEHDRTRDRSARVTERLPLPVGLDAAQTAMMTSTAARAAPGEQGGLDELGRRLGLPAGLLAPGDDALRHGRALLARIRAAVRVMAARRPSAARPRRPVVVVGALGILCLGVAVAIAATESPPVDPLASAAEEPDGGSLTETPLPGDARDSGDAAEEASADDLPDASSEPSAEQWAPLVATLVDRWLACAAAPDPACAEAAAQLDSAASEQLLGPAAGRAAALTTLAAWAEGARSSVVVDRHGGAVVVDLIDGETTTASLLVMRSEAGWRIRSVLSGGSG